MSPEWRRLAVCAFLKKLAVSRKPIVIGPVRGEVGFEFLYLLPFLRWAQQYANLDPKRFVVLSRGGAGALYGANCIDLYTLRSVESVRKENLYDWHATKMQKQTRITEWDRDVLKEAAAHVLGRGEKYAVLHPSWMYWALSPFWDEQRGLKYLLSMTNFTPLPKPPVPDTLTLPERFVAMKWYDRATFPKGHPDVNAAIVQLTANLAAQTPIVLLSSPHQTDDHSDILVKHPQVSMLPEVPPEQNLALQAAVLGRATAFVGTYGGVAQLALRMGVPSVSLYTEFGGTATAHVDLSHYLSKATKVPFLSGSLNDVGIWNQTLTVPQAQPSKELVPA